VIQAMSSAGSTAILNPGVFSFFKGMDFGPGGKCYVDKLEGDGLRRGSG
jgi:hypothetical protein